ncbi:MAG: ABC transporter ATP-binding protein [Actinobacteria bacterium]|nr:ABC transporter ATP-binding protein [Actinomycetota bacterium]
MSAFGVEELTVRYGDTIALDDITLSLPAGEVTAVVGGDGAGKSTLLAALVGLVAPSMGVVRAPDDAHLGYLPASAGSWAELTVMQNMMFTAEVFGDVEAARVEELLRRAQLWQARDRLARALSGGMRKKLGFCMAVASSPELIVLDEPSTGVDPVSRVELWRLIADAAVSGAAVVMASTYLDEAERANRVLALDHGAALLQGQPDELRSAMPGAVARVDEPRDPRLAWRYGRGYREWFPDANTPVPAEEPDLETAVIVASLARELEGGRL